MTVGQLGNLLLVITLVAFVWAVARGIFSAGRKKSDGSGRSSPDNRPDKE